MISADEEIIFMLGDVRLRAELLDDGSTGCKLDTAKSMVHGISLPAAAHMRDALTVFLTKEGYE